MNALNQIRRGDATGYCPKYSWCDGTLHGDDEGAELHSRSRYFLEGTCEVALELDDGTGIPDVWVTFANLPNPDPHAKGLQDVFHSPEELGARAAELRMISDAIQEAVVDLELLQANLREVPC